MKIGEKVQVHVTLMAGHEPSWISGAGHSYEFGGLDLLRPGSCWVRIRGGWKDGLRLSFREEQVRALPEQEKETVQL